MKKSYVRVRKDVPCVGCGAIMHDVTDRKMYCKECTLERQRIYRRTFIEKKRAKPEPKKDNIPDIVKLAKEKNMSYGVYMALYGG